MAETGHIDGGSACSVPAGLLTELEWQQLLKKVKEGRCTPFLGAGVDKAMLPLGGQIAEKWAVTYGYPVPDRSDFARVAQCLALNFSFPEHYVESKSGNLIFRNPGDLPLSDVQRRDWKSIEKTLRDLNKAVSGLLTYIREQYMEIDLKETNKMAWVEFLRDEESFGAMLAKKRKKDSA